MEKGVDERSRPVTRRRMDNNSSWFVQDQKLIVFKKHLERDRLAFEFQRFRLRNIHRDLVARLDFLTRFDDLIVDADTPEFDQPLERRARHIPLTIDEKDIQPLRLLPSCDQEFRNHVRHTLLKSAAEMQLG